MHKNTRPAYLQNMDIVQDAIEAADPGDGLTLRQISEKTSLSYGEAQAATVLLRNKGRVNWERRGRSIHFIPKP